MQPEFVRRHKEYLRQYYKANAEKLKARAKARYWAKREEIRAYQNSRKKPRKSRITGLSRTDPQYDKKYYLEIYVEKTFLTRFRALQKVAKKAVPECDKCGEKDWRVLEINHMNGGGGKERKKYKRGIASSIIEGSRAIDDLNVLCCNCNKKYEYERGRRNVPANCDELLRREIENVRNI